MFLELITAATATGAGTPRGAEDSKSRTYQASGTTTAGSGAATILVQGSNDGSNWDTIGTITLTLGTTSTSDSFTSLDRYGKLRGNVSAISGTGASVNVTAGV